MSKRLGRFFWLCVCMALLTGCKDTNTAKIDTAEIVSETTLATQPQETESEIIEEESSEESIPDDSFDITIRFAGDINLDENWGTTKYWDMQENGIRDCISSELIAAMQEADIMCLNNEFTYSTGGTPLPDKMYTFRANPSRVKVLQELGVDTVYLANNHIYDYGKEAMLDTFSTLEEAGIRYFGAGRNLEQAMQPDYWDIQGKRISFVAASRAEKYKMTPQAKEDAPGILRCYDPDLFIQAIKEAKEHSDFCIAVVHWGTEYSTQLEQVQLETGKQYLDAGADVVIGAHSHCLQGMEIYDGKPIIYSLGNYWFNEKTLDTELLTLHLTGEGDTINLDVQVIPAIQKDYQTTYLSDPADQRKLYDYLESISINTRIDDEGYVLKK